MLRNLPAPLPGTGKIVNGAVRTEPTSNAAAQGETPHEV